MTQYLEELSQKFNEEGLKRLKEIKSKGVHEFIEKFLKILNPKKVYVSIGTQEDKECIKRRAIEEKEEEPLKIPNHTIHFDGYYDQGRN